MSKFCSEKIFFKLFLVFQQAFGHHGLSWKPLGLITGTEERVCCVRTPDDYYIHYNHTLSLICIYIILGLDKMAEEPELADWRVVGKGAVPSNMLAGNMDEETRGMLQIKFDK